MAQFLATIGQIYRADGVSTPSGVYRHLKWQVRRLFGRFPVELRISRSRIAVDRASGVGALVNCMNLYDFNNMSFLQRILTDSRYVFFDVGANIGTYTLVASEVTDAKVVSFEPHPRAFSLLEQNVRLNSRTNVRLINAALSDDEGRLWLTDLSELSINRIAESYGVPAVAVDSRRADVACRELGVVPQIVKLDVEGHEERALRGFGDCLSDVLVLFVERGERPSLLRFLQDWGFEGPYYAHFRHRRITSRPQARAEDSIYFRPRFRERLSALGFSMEP